MECGVQPGLPAVPASKYQPVSYIASSLLPIRQSPRAFFSHGTCLAFGLFCPGLSEISSTTSDGTFTYQVVCTQSTISRSDPCRRRKIFDDDTITRCRSTLRTPSV
jgi:hypothetical protein